MNRAQLLEQLEDEIAVGWPEPWHAQDFFATLPWDAPLPEATRKVLATYLDIVGDLLERATDPRGHVIPLNRKAA